MSRGLKISADLTLPQDAVTRTQAILAIKGSGKTYTGGVLAEEMLEIDAQVVVLDPIGVWWGLRLAADGRSPGYPIKVFGGLRGDLPLPPESGRLIAKLITTKRFSAVLDISMMRKADRKRFAADFAEELFEQKKSQRSPLHLFLEEAHTFIPQIMRKGEGVERMVCAFEDIGTQGRNYGLGLTIISQRPAAVAKAVLNQAECVYVLRILGKHERKALTEWMDEQDMPDKERLLAEVQSLPNGTACVWSPGWLGRAVKVQIREKRTFDSSSTPKASSKRRLLITAGKLSAIDVHEIEQAMAEVIAKVEADDPAKLRRKIVELERALVTTQRAAPTAPSIRVAKEKRVEVPVLDVKEIGRVEKIIERLNDIGNRTISTSNQLLDGLRRAEERLRAAKVAPAPQSVAARAMVAKAHADIERRTVAAPPPTGSYVLTKGDRAVLTVLVQFPGGVTRRKFSIMSGYAPNGSSMRAILAHLRREEYVEDAGELTRITQVGTAALGDWTPLPSGEALLAHWRGELPECASRLLGILADEFPNGLTQEELEERSAATGTRYVSGGSSMRAGLARLRGLDLVVDAGNLIKASSEMFG